MAYDAITYTARGADKHFLLASNINQILNHKCMCGFHTIESLYGVMNYISTHSLPSDSIHVSVINVFWL